MSAGAGVRRLQADDVREGGEQGRRHGRLEVSLREARQAVLEGDRLALLGELQPAVDRAARLREDAGMRGAAAPSRRAATPVEDRQLDVPARRDARQLLLGAVDLPLGRQIAAVLARVRVAHHHLEARAGAAVEDLLHERPGSAQVGDRLE